VVVLVFLIPTRGIERFEDEEENEDEGDGSRGCSPDQRKVALDA